MARPDASLGRQAGGATGWCADGWAVVGPNGLVDFHLDTVIAFDIGCGQPR